MGKEIVALLNSNVPIMNPHTKIVQRWNKFFVISCLVAIFTDLLFFFLLNVDQASTATERFTWVATRGVDEEGLLEHLPEDLQKDLRRHFFLFLQKVRIFTLMDETMLDAFCERLRQKLYLHGSEILYHGGPVEKMIFTVRGKAESIGAYGIKTPLSEDDVCGEELLTWYLENSSVNKGQKLYSTRTVRCLTNLEAFALRAADLKNVTKHFSRFLRNPCVQGAIRYESPYWRDVAATRIQVAWRYRKKLSMRFRIPRGRKTEQKVAKMIDKSRARRGFING